MHRTQRAQPTVGGVRIGSPFGGRAELLDKCLGSSEVVSAVTLLSIIMSDATARMDHPHRQAIHRAPQWRSNITSIGP